MENIIFRYRMLGVLTLFHPDVEQTLENIRLYAPLLDRLIIWDNSPLELQDKAQLLPRLSNLNTDIVWVGDGENRCIAPAINHAWQMAQQEGFDFILIMDQDSRWTNFMEYRRLIEQHTGEGDQWVFTPYVEGCDQWTISSDIQFTELFINSGTVIPTKLLTDIGGADEAFPLDALDHDMAFRIRQKGYQIACLTTCRLVHSIGNPTKSEALHLTAHNYPAMRIYSIARSHIINLRKHSHWLKRSDKWRIVREYVLLPLVRILFLESGKWERLKMLMKGIRDGLCYSLPKNHTT